MTNKSTKEAVNTIKIEILEQAGALVGPMSFSFTISSLRNPFSTATSDSFKAIFMSENNFAIAIQSSGLKTSASVPSPFKDITISRGSKENGVLTNYQFVVKLQNPAPNGSILVVAMPSEIKALTMDQDAVDCAGRGSLKGALECKLIGNQIVTSLAFSSAKVLESGESLELEFFNIKNPISLMPTKSLSFDLKSSDGVYAISAAHEGHPITNTQASIILVADVEAINPTLGEASAYRVEFTPITALPKSAIIVIILPVTLVRSKKAGSEVSCVGLANLEQVLGCSYDEIDHKVIVQTGIKRNQFAPTQTIFEIDGFQNPTAPRFT